MKLLAKFGKWPHQTFDGGCVEINVPQAFDASLIENAGWRQGSLLPVSMVGDLVDRGLLPAQSDEGIWCVLTQDCDLVHHDISSEPKIEVIFARHVDKPNKGYTWSKNARELHLRDESIERSLAFHTRDRVTIPRLQLCNNLPHSVSLGRESIKLLARWISRKYFRAAFPNKFNDRIGKKTEEKIKKLLQSSPGHFQEIHIQVTNEELADNQDYNAIILCIAADETSENEEDYKATMELGENFCKLLNDCNGINVKKCEVRSRDEVTLEDLDSMQRWDFDSITIRQSDTIEGSPIDH